MAQFNSDQATLQTDEVDAKRALGKKTAGRLRMATVQWTTDGTQAATDTIRLMFSAHPVQVVPQLSHVHCDSDIAATTATLDIGDDSGLTSPDADRYADGIDIHDGANQLYAFTEDAVPAACGTPYVTGNGEWIEATLATLTGAATDGAVVTFTITYVVN